MDVLAVNVDIAAASACQFMIRIYGSASRKNMMNCFRSFMIALFYSYIVDKGGELPMSADTKALQNAISEITEIASGFGLDFYPMRYEICPADIIYTFGAYGMPTRFPTGASENNFSK